ncbi:MAG: matrixin family metalloprotease [Chthoniobacterales bacterium]|nr:matrixin family metalloprotease [Chthoniobacterales bacterium]
MEIIIGVRSPLSAMTFIPFQHTLRFLLAALAPTFFSLTAHGFALENVSWPDGTVVTLQMSLGSLSQTLQDGSSSWNFAALPATDQWNARMARIQFATVLNSSAPLSSGDEVNSVAFSSTVFGDAFGSGVLAVTYYWTQSGGVLTEADVLFNTAQTFDSYRGDLQFDSQGRAIADIRRVFLHELGHALGLNHPDEAHQQVDAIMNSLVSDAYLLTPDDIAGIHSLYGAPDGSGTPTPTPAPTPVPNVPSRLVNLSTRSQVGTGDNVLIGGFIIQGDKRKKVLLRGLGPSLGASGVQGALQDPRMTLFDASGVVLETNDNWQESPEIADIKASTIPPTDRRESAIVAQLDPGNYTVIVEGVNNTTGIGLVENYTLDTYSGSRAANISTRGHVGSGDDALIGGFIIRGNTTKQVLVRALGPSLGASTSSGVLANPLVELRDGDGQLVATNDNWQSGSQEAEIRASGIPPADPRESALITTLGPGDYTALVRGADGGEGIGLVEIYDVDQ